MQINPAPSLGPGPIFFSTLTYDLHRRAGAERAGEIFLDMVRRPDRNVLPVARVAARVAALTSMALFHGASSCLPKARSRAAAEAHKSDAPFWLMCDDDVEAPVATIVDLIRVAGAADQPRISVLPCLLRGDATHSTLNLEFEAESRLDVEAAAWVRPVRVAGCGMMVVTRAAIRKLWDTYKASLMYLDSDGVDRVALFNMLILAGQTPDHDQIWLGEDYSFCWRAREAGIPIVGLVQGVSTHAGQGLELDSLR